MGLDEHEDSIVDDLILQRQQTQEEKDEEMQRDLNQLNSENVDLKFQVSEDEISEASHELLFTNRPYFR